MSVTAEDLNQYNGQRVIVTKNLKEPNEKGESAVEVEGTVESANALGLLIKPKGKVNNDIIEIGDIEEVRFAPQKLTPIKQKDLQLVTFGGARKHLAERHGIELGWLNEHSEEEALAFHTGLDHSNLGHRHVEKTDEKASDENTSDAA